MGDGEVMVAHIPLRVVQWYDDSNGMSETMLSLVLGKSHFLLFWSTETSATPHSK